MKLEIFTTNKKTTLDKSIRYSLFSALLLLLSFGQATAQCPLGCNNNVQISLDGDCSVEVTPDMVLEGQGGDNCDYVVVILGSNGQPINTPMGPNGGPTITGDFIGETLTAEVRLGSNSCWGTLTIEDKLAPSIMCLEDITIDCYEDSDVPLPIAVDNCDLNAVVTVLSDEIVDLDCTNGFSARRTIIYQAEDDSGNLSALCTRNIFFERISLESVVFPDSRDDVEASAFACDSTAIWDLNGNGYPDPEESGTPTTADGFSIFPNLSYCELNVTFTDDVLPICESSFKVLREWTVLDWCTGTIRQDFQIVKVVDNAGPIVTCNIDLIGDNGLDADPYTCTADWDVIPPTVVFDCSSTTYTVGYLLADDNGAPPINGFYITTNVVTNSDGTLTINDLPLGRTWIKYTISDACGNSTECFTEVDVVDNVPPVPVCDEFTVATLTNGGFARIFSNTFDDGSHDNCSEVTFEVRRMGDACNSGTAVFGDFVDFCCNDLGNEVMVALKVTDANGNSNTCMVVVTVQDKLDPVITCPPNVTVDCGTDINDLTITGEAVGTDNCGDPEVTFQDFGELNSCNTGTITRRWRAEDAGGRSVTCNQSITVADFTPFTMNPNNWPPNVELDGCMNVDTDPSNTGTPTYTDSECSQIADTYEDQVFTFADGACFKILRTWSVIDWCQFNQSAPSNGGIWQYTQVIKVNNANAPVFDNCNNLVVDAFGENCDEFVELTIGATDDCTPASELVYSYELNLDNDDDIEFTGNTNDASRTLPVGTHKITWFVEDRCGNQEMCMQFITVRDRKKPTPYCRAEITTVIMPSTGEIAIWANDFDLGSTDNCPGELRFSFSSNVNNTSATFFCEDVGLQILDIWVTDASGNQDFCTTQINIQANEGCDGSRIAGDVHAENYAAVEEVTVTLENMTSHEQVEFTTANSGHYQFLNMGFGQNYELRAEKDGDYHNGVNTLDIVKIQRHILGLEDLDSPYKLIAADANGDEKIKASDLLTVRKLVLGVSDDFGSNNTSWKFIADGYNFADVTDPFPYTDAEVIAVNNFSNNVMDNHFMAVKIGDVDMSAETSNVDGDDEVESRSGNSLNISVANARYNAGDLVSIPVTVDNASEIIGMQFTLETEGMVYESTRDGAISLSEQNIAQVGNDLAISWNVVTAQSYDEGEVLFTVNYRATSNGSLSNALSLTSNTMNAEAYDGDLETVDVELTVREQNVEGGLFELKQNTPNPFVDNTVVSFNLPQSGTATLKIFDITGKVLSQYARSFNKGINTINIDGADLQATGVMYYQLEFAGQVQTKKMISIAR